MIFSRRQRSQSFRPPFWHYRGFCSRIMNRISDTVSIFRPILPADVLVFRPSRCRHETFLLRESVCHFDSICGGQSSNEFFPARLARFQWSADRRNAREICSAVWLLSLIHI